MVDRLDVDGCDVVGQQHQLVGMDFVFVLVRQVLGRDQAALQQPGDEGAGPGEGVDDVDALATKGLAELGLQNVGDAVDDEVHHLDRRVDNAQPLSHLGEGVAEELVVELDDDLLLAGRVVDALGAHLHAFVEPLEGVRLFVQPVLLQHVEHTLHGQRHGVVLGKAVVFEQGVKHRLGDEVLGQHLNDLAIADAAVEVVAQFSCEGVEGRALLCVGRVTHDAGDAVDVGSGDLGDVVGPVFPVVAVADLLHQLGVDGLFNFADFKRQGGLVVLSVALGFRLTDGEAALASVLVLLPLGLLRLLLNLVGDGDDLHLAGISADEVQFVDHRVEAVVVRTKRLQHLPHHGIGFVVAQRIVRLNAGWDDDRQDDVATLLARGVAHDPANRLHHVHLRVARGQEQHGIQRWHIHPFRQTAHVAQNAAGVVGCVGLEPSQLGFFFAGVHAAVHMVGFTGQRRCCFIVF